MENPSLKLVRKIVRLIRKSDATPVEKHKALDIVGGLNPYELVAMDTPIVISYTTV